MTLAPRILIRWVQLSALATALCLLVYVTAQQIGRQMANDPQVQLARDARTALSAGQSLEDVVPQSQTELGTTIAPFLTIQNDSGRVLASSARLHGQLRSLPSGVLANVRQYGEESVTWQPEPGVRMATVAVRVPGPPIRFVVAGRSLDETEIRISRLGQLILFGWLATLVGLLVVVAGTEAVGSRLRNN